jgi:hypothetical protein
VDNPDQSPSDLFTDDVCPQQPPTPFRTQLSPSRAVFPVVHTPYDYDERI